MLLMITRPDVTSDFWLDNKTIITRYLVAALAVSIVVTSILLIQEDYRFFIVTLVPLLFVMTIISPRLAFYQFLFFLFTNISISTGPTVLLVDVSAFFVACAALLDVLLKGASPRFPRLTVNFALLFAAVAVAAVWAHDPSLSISRLVRLLVLIVTFVSLCHLFKYFSVGHLVRAFFWFCVLHGVVALTPLIISGEVQRFFGFAPTTLDDLAMISIPIGLVLYLWSKRAWGVGYLAGIAVLFSALLATQSRLTLLFALVFSGLAAFLSIRMMLKKADAAPAALGIGVRRRIKVLAVLAGVVVVASAAIHMELINVVLVRFQSLLTTSPSGTFRMRLVLWQSGLSAFWDNPLLGIGPGNFRVIHELYQELRFNPIQLYIEGLSAHNLVIHYMAETGLVGTSALVALLFNQFRLARAYYKTCNIGRNPELGSVVYMIAALFVITSFVEAGWMWGQVSFVFAFFAALIVHARDGRSDAT